MPSSDYIYGKYRRADDAPGDLAWASKQAKRAVWVPAEELTQAELTQLDLSEDEQVLVRLLKLPRMYLDAETCGALTDAESRRFMRALHAADLLQLMDPEKARALIPIEVKRAREAITGKGPSKAGAKKRRPGRLRAQVYRPSMDGSDRSTAQAAPARAQAQPQQREAAVASAGQENSESQALAQEIVDFYKKIKKANFFDVLDVPRDVTTAQVKQAYFELAKKYHPDRLAGHSFAEPVKVEQRMEAVFNRIGEAYKALQKDDSRKEYRERIQAGLTENMDASGERVRRPGEALVQHRKGQVFLQRKDFAQARRMFKIAAELDLEDPLFPSYVAWCDFLDEKRPRPERAREARDALGSLLQKSPHAQTAYFLGMVLKLDGDDKSAGIRFKKAVELDPNHAEASREVRLAELRRQKGKPEGSARGSGLLDRLKKR